MFLPKINITIIYLFILLIGPYAVLARTAEVKQNKISILFDSFQRSIKSKDITQANSLRLSTAFYSKLLDSEINTSLARIIIMINSKNGVLNRMYPTKKYMCGTKNENWYWHSFILYNSKVFDPNFTIAPCNLRKYFDIVWHNDKNIRNFSLYSIQMKDLISFMNIRTKRNKAYFDYVPVRHEFLIKTPLHLSKKKAKNGK